MIREELELDISEASRAIDSVGDLLTRTAEQFRGELSDAVDVLADIPVSIDTSEITPEISAAVDAADVDVVVPVEADTTSVTSEIDTAVDAADTNIIVDADATAVTAEIDDAIQAADTEVEVDASGATESLNDLDEAGLAAAGSLDSVGSSGALFGTIAQGAAGDASGLLSTLGKIGPAGAIAAAGLGAVVATTGGVVASAIPVETAFNAYTAGVGDLADEIDDIEIGDLTYDLTGLATEMGSSWTQTRLATLNLVKFGESAGAADDEITETAKNVLILSANARAVNPSLGEMGDIAGQLTSRLARGGRSLVQYGVSLNAAEIRTRAAANSGKDLNDEFSQFELLQAGAQIALERTGGSIEENITRASDDATIRLSSLQKTWAGALIAIGQPLVSPVLDMMEAAIPIGAGVAEVLGEIGGILVPIATSLITSLRPLSDLITDLTLEQWRAFEPLLARTGDLIEELLGAAMRLEPVIHGNAAALVGAAEGAERLLSVAGPLVGFFSDVQDGALESSGGLLSFAQTYLGTLSTVDPATRALFLINDLWNAIGGPDQEKAEAAIHSTREALYGTSTALGDVAQEQSGLTDELLKYVTTEGMLSDGDVAKHFKNLGYEASAFQDDIADLDDGYNRFIQRALRSDQIKIELHGVEQSAEQIAGLGGDLVEYVRRGDAVVTENKDMVEGFYAQQQAVEAAAQAQFEATAATHGWTAAQQAELFALGTVTFGTHSYQNALAAVALQQQQLASESPNSVVLPLERQSSAWVSLADAVLRGDVTTDNYIQSLAGLGPQLGVSDEQLGAFVESINTKVTEIATTITQNIPSASAAFDGLEESTDPAQLTANLQAQTATITQFEADLRFLLEQGYDDIVQFLAEQGPAIGGAPARALAEGRPELATELEGTLEEFQGSTNSIDNFLRNEAAAKIAGADGAVAQLAQQATSELGLNLDFSNAAEAPVENLGVFLVNDPRPGWAGEDIGRDLTSGMVKGMDETVWEVREAAADAVRQAEEAARREAESNSPSKLFASLGEDLTAGLVLGVQADQASVDQAFESIIRGMANDLVGVTASSVNSSSVTNNVTNQAPLVGAMTVVTPQPSQSGADVVRSMRSQAWLTGRR